jgi:hypothetical protein
MARSRIPSVVQQVPLPPTAMALTPSPPRMIAAGAVLEWRSVPRRSNTTSSLCLRTLAQNVIASMPSASQTCAVSALCSGVGRAYSRHQSNWYSALRSRYREETGTTAS